MTTRDIPMSLPLDGDGFLRRECPNCGRQFKWFPTEGEPNEASQYYCPYCGEPASIDAWWTKEQIEYATQLLSAEIVGPELEKSARGLKRLNKPGSLVRFEWKYKAPSRPRPLQEPHDMRKVEPRCHPNEPLKVYEDWAGPVACLICGKRFSQ